MQIEAGDILQIPPNCTDPSLRSAGITSKESLLVVHANNWSMTLFSIEAGCVKGATWNPKWNGWRRIVEANADNLSDEHKLLIVKARLRYALEGEQ